jgi:hypothetical protein
MSEFSKNDREKLEQLLKMLRGEKIKEGEEEVDFLCTHCHCKVCSTIKNSPKKSSE